MQVFRRRANNLNRLCILQGSLLPDDWIRHFKSLVLVNIWLCGGSSEKNLVYFFSAKDNWMNGGESGGIFRCFNLFFRLIIEIKETQVQEISYYFLGDNCEDGGAREWNFTTKWRGLRKQTKLNWARDAREGHREYKTRVSPCKSSHYFKGVSIAAPISLSFSSSYIGHIISPK